MNASLSMLSDILRQGVLVVLLVGCAASLLYGIWMLLRPQGALRFNQYASGWFSTERIARSLDAPHATERFFYRHHRIVGAFVLGGAIYMLHVLSLYNQQADLTAIFGRLNAQAGNLLQDSVAALIVLGSAFSGVVGAFLLIRPSLLKNFEGTLNRWFSTDRPLQSLDAAHYAPDRFASRNARVVAALIIAGSTYALIALAPLAL